MAPNKFPKLSRDEHTEQVRFFELVDRHSRKHTELLNVFAIPNGGHRHISVARKLKAEGVRAGYPDIAIDVAKRGFHGMRIEMKRDDKAKMTSRQKDWFSRLSNAGYLCERANGCMDAWVKVCWYLGINGV